VGLGLLGLAPRGSPTVLGACHLWDALWQSCSLSVRTVSMTQVCLSTLFKIAQSFRTLVSFSNRQLSKLIACKRGAQSSSHR
jgi:hypothetical protein